MIDFIIEKMHDARFMTMLLAGIAASATAYTLITPLFAGQDLNKRMKAVASERERLTELDRENRELKRANDILRKASALFAQAELDRRSK